MTVEETVVQRLLMVPAVTALVQQRISPHTRDQDPSAVPAITYQRLNSDDILTLEGPDGTGKVSLQIDAWAATPSAAVAVAAAVKAVLIDFPGPGIEAAFRKSSSGPVQDPEVYVFRVRSVYDVHYAEGVAA